MSTTPTTAPKTAGRIEESPAAQVEVDKAAYDEALSKARSNALATLRTENRDRFNQLIAAEMKANGHEWKPRPTKAEKAEEALRKLLAENPELQAKVTVVDPA